jgi:hypothetical protein
MGLTERKLALREDKRQKYKDKKRRLSFWFMRIINTPWEERNTGLKSCEIVFERGDTLKDYLEAGIEDSYEFSVVKIPVGNLKLVHQLEDIGYKYLENQLVLTFDTDQVESIDTKWSRLLEGFSCRQISTGEELDNVLTEVHQNMFETDRFSLDPFWKTGLSSERYTNWITDLFNSGTTQIYIIKKNNLDVGFYSVKRESETVNSCPIAGIYNRYKSSGYIFVLTWFWLIISREMGYIKLTTMVSSNNRIMMSSISRVFSFSIKEISIVLRKLVSK